MQLQTALGAALLLFAVAVYAGVPTLADVVVSLMYWRDDENYKGDSGLTLSLAWEAGLQD